MHENSENLNEDLYSHINLAAFSFGAPTVHHDTDMPSPLSVQAPSESGHSHTTGSTDRTPRPSISHTRDSGESGGEDEIRRIRAKIRAIDNGGRRPSLPTNLDTSDRPSTDGTAGPSSRSNPETSGSDSEPLASGNTSDIDFDPGSESGVVDTDVELEGIAPDDSSQHTFGLDQVRSSYAFDFVAKFDCAPPPSPSICNSVQIGILSIPTSVAKKPVLLLHSRPTQMMTTQMCRKVAPVDSPLYDAAALPFAWLLRGTAPSTQ